MRRDRGATLVELTVVIAVIGVLSAALLGGISVLLRTHPVVTDAIAENHDEQQLTNYLYGDVRSTSAIEVSDDTTLGYSRRVGAAGCPGNPGLNVLQLTWAGGTRVHRASYRLVTQAGATRLDRFLCEGDSIVALGATGSVNIADALDPAPAEWNGSGPPAAAVIDDGVVTVVLYQSGRELTMAAALQSFGALPTIPSATTTTPVLPTTTTTTTAVATTTTTTTAGPVTTTLPPITGPPGVLDDVCDVLADITAQLTTPTAATTLLRQFGADGLSGVLTSPVRVSSGVNAGVDIKVADLNLSLNLCATAQLTYNTGTRQVTVPMQVSGSCTFEADVVILFIVVRVCLNVQLTLYVDLPIDTAQAWTSGNHELELVGPSGAALIDTTGVAVVEVDSSTIPTTTTTSTTTLPPVTVPAQSNPVNPITPARGFSVITSGNTTLVSSAAQGGIAVGGDFVFRNWFNVATSASSNLTLPGETGTTGLLVGGNIDLATSSDGNLTVGQGFAHTGALTGTPAQIYGSAVHVVRTGTAANDNWSTPRVIVSADQTNQTANAVLKPGVFPFTNTFVLFNHYAKRMGQLDPTTCAGVVYPQFYEQNNNPDNWVLHLSKNKLNVLNVTSSQLSSITSVTGPQNPSIDTPLIINITDVGPVTIPTTWWGQWQNGDWSSIIWNVPNSTSVTLADNSTLYGSLYAPSAAVSMSNVQVNGDIVAASLTTNGGSIQLQHFTASVPCLV